MVQRTTPGGRRAAVRRALRGAPDDAERQDREVQAPRARSHGRHRRRPRGNGGAAMSAFKTAVSEVEDGRVIIRGYSHEEIIGRLPYATATFLTIGGPLS